MPKEMALNKKYKFFKVLTVAKYIIHKRDYNIIQNYVKNFFILNLNKSYMIKYQRSFNNTKYYLYFKTSYFTSFINFRKII